MNGREDQKSNDLFYLCSLIEYIARKTKNRPNVIINALGKENVSKIYELADIYHSDNIDRVSDDFIRECNISKGSFDNVGECRYQVPSYWDIGKVYQRLILMVSKESGHSVVDCVLEVFDSPIVDLIENYNSSFYYDSPAAIFDTYEHDFIPA